MANNGLFDLSDIMSDNISLSDSILEAAQDVSIPVPNKTEIDEDTYNAAIDALQKSFKEGSELLDLLAKGVNTTDNTVSEFDESVREAQSDAIGNAILEACDNGPMFESAGRKDKTDIKEIVTDVRPDVEKILKKAKIPFNPMNKLTRWLSSVGSLSYSWQMLGVASASVRHNFKDRDDSEINEIVDSLNKVLEKKLDGYKIFAIYCTWGQTWKTSKQDKKYSGGKKDSYDYMLIVDKTVTKDLKKAVEEFSRELSSNAVKDSK